MFGTTILLQAATQAVAAGVDPYTQLLGHGILGVLSVIMLGWNYRLTGQLQAAQQARVDDAKAYAVQLQVAQQSRVDDAKTVLVQSLQLADKVSTAVHQTAETAEQLVRLQGGPR